MKIRRAEHDDRSAIREVARRAWGKSYDGILGEHAIDETVEDWYSEEHLDAAFSRSETVFLVAVENDEVVGFSHGVSEGEQGDVLRIYVDPDHWGKRIGTQLLERTRDELSERGVKRLKAMVLAANETGNQFYRDFGLELTATNRTEIDGEEYEENLYAMDV